MGMFTSNEMTKDKFKGSKSICHYEVSRIEVENMKFVRFDNFMKTLKSYRTAARQKVFFTFGGYDLDERELFEIPEVLKYIREMIKLHPYFWYFAITYNSVIFVQALLIDENNVVYAKFDNIRRYSIDGDPEKEKALASGMEQTLIAFGEKINDSEGAKKSLEAWINLS